MARLAFSFLAAILLASPSAHAVDMVATFNTATDVPVTASSYTATGSTVDISLNFAPPTGTNLTVVNNTGLDFIHGTFNNLAQGQAVDLSFGGTMYHFVANYYGGTGNDLVLQWAITRAVAWGYNGVNQLGDGSATVSLVPGAVTASGVLAGKTVIAVAAGDYHGLALCSDGTLAAWGDNNSGQLGDGSTTNSSVPVAVSNSGILAGRTVIAVAAGGGHSLALCSDGTLAAWGNNEGGQLGNNTLINSSLPVLVNTAGVLAGKTVIAMAAGVMHTVVLCTDGTLAAWGANTSGQLGNNSTTGSLVPAAVNTSGVLAGKTVIAMAAGQDHNLALCSDHTLVAWGYNGYGQLGNNGTTQSPVPVAVNTSGVLSGKTVIAVSGGRVHSLALCSDGTLAAWGYNLFGQLGNNNTTDSLVPVAVDRSGVLAGKTVITLAGGADHSLALCSDGTLAAWGWNEYGTLGDNSTTDSHVPVAVSTASLSTGERFVVGTTGQGSAFSLGLSSLPPAVVLAHLLISYNSAADVPITASSYTARGTIVCSLNFAPPTGTSLTVINNTGLDFIHGTFDNLAQGQAVALSFGGTTYHFVANYYGGTGNDLVLQWANTEAVAWGFNIDGQLGNDSAQACPVPVPVNNSGVLAGKTVITLAGGGNHSLALCSDGTLAAWGGNSLGQLGNGNTTDSVVPVAVYRSGALAGKTVIAVAASIGHSLALCSDGTIAAWGGNDSGQLGNNSRTSSTVPVAVNTSGVLAGKTVVAISAGQVFSLALCSDGTLASWGGIGLVPVAVNGTGALAGKTVVAMAAGGQHALALCSDGTLAAWGSGGNGQLGNGSLHSSTVPVAVDRSGVLAGKTITALAAGTISSLALCSDGALMAWGVPSGSGILTNPSLPVAVDTSGVLAGKRVIAMAAGSEHSLALCSDGTLAAWGDNTDDELGNGIDNLSGNTTYSTVPVAVSSASLPAGSRFVVAASGSKSFHSLGIVALSAPLPAAPCLAVVLPAGTNLISGNPSAVDFGHPIALDFGTLPVGTRASKILTLKNTGTAPLKISRVTLTGPNPGRIAITRFPGATVAPGSYTCLMVTYTASSRSVASAVLHITSNDPTAPLFDVSFTANWSDYPFGSPISAGPASLLVPKDKPSLLLVDGRGANSTFQWRKDNVLLPGATRSSYNIAPTTFANAGIYTVSAYLGGNEAGPPTVSSPANLGVVNVAPRSVTLAAGSTLTLTASAAGPGLTYQWRKNDTAIFDGTNPANSQGTISGATTLTLSISNTSAADAGSYTCLVTMPDAGQAGASLSLASGMFTVKITYVSPRSVILAAGSTLTLTASPFEPGLTYQWRKDRIAIADGTDPVNNLGSISGATTLTLSITNLSVADAGSYTCLMSMPNPKYPGSLLYLPSGVFTLTVTNVMRDASGHFHGKPLVAITTPTARNAFGASAPMKVDATVQPLSENATGSFNGLVDRDAVLSSGYGGTLNIASLPNGILTGRLTLGALSYRFTNRYMDAGVATPAATVVIPRELPLHPLTLAFTINPDTGELTGSVTDGVIATPVSVHASRNPWDAVGHKCPLATTYTCELALDPALVGNPAYPQGTGYGALTINPIGLATWCGRMADGAVTTAAATMGPTAAVPLHFMLYASTGSAHGWVTATDGAPANNELHLLHGSLDWMKNENTDLASKAGIPLNTLTVTGGEHVKFANSIRVRQDEGP